MHLSSETWTRMQIEYTVHSAHVSKVEVELPFNGKSVKALVDGLVVELVSTDEVMGHTLRFVPDDMADAQQLFAVGNTVTATFALTAAAPPVLAPVEPAVQA